MVHAPASQGFRYADEIMIVETRAWRGQTTTPEGEMLHPQRMCPAGDRKQSQACDREAVGASQVRRICPSRPSRVG